MGWTLISVLIIVGLLFMVVEILLIPGTSFAGIIGFICIAVGVWQAFAAHSLAEGLIVLGATMAMTFMVLYFSLKSNTWKRFMLKDENTTRLNVITESDIKPGDTGVALSRLALAGTVEINGKEYEAHTFGEFVNQGTTVTVVKIENNKIFVKTQ
jgi:membrane-bound ClpP family serine protease